MIKRINVLKGVGRFSALNPTRGTEGDFSSLNVIYASNACGKSTLCDVFRSLDTGNPAYVIGRKRLGSDVQQEIVISLEGGASNPFPKRSVA
jgi:wobble nucleotide-excising tRNase